MALTEQELSAIQPDHVVDAIGEVCPHTLNLALHQLKKAKSGDVIVEITDHTIATKTIPAAVKMNQLAEVLGIRNEKGIHHIYLKKL
jgi:TusA-related sulfurtransferase